MKFLTFRKNPIVFVFFLFLAYSGFAQTTTPTPLISEEDQVIKVDSRLVVVPVSVVNANGEPVLGLKAQDFLIAEENRRQTVDNVGDAEKVPLEIALLIDVSGSVNPLFEFEKRAAAQFLKSVMRPDDRATIFLIGDKPVLAHPRDTAAQAAERIRSVTLSGKFTAFYDTVAAASKYLQQSAPVKSRRVILALTDGEDNWSSLTRDAETATYRNVEVNKLTLETRNQLAAKTDSAHKNAQKSILRGLQDADTVFYVINPAGASYKLNKISTRAQNGLQSFADETGGTAFLPQFNPVDTKDQLQNSTNSRRNGETLEKIFRQIANELRAQYLVQYYSESDFPQNKFVKLNVALQNPANFRVRARQGYYVKN